MLKKYYLNNKKRNFSTASIWIEGGSDMDSIGKKGINKILCSLLTRGCEGFDNLNLSEYIESHGAELNKEVFEDEILVKVRSTGKLLRSKLSFKEDKSVLNLLEDEHGISPGQACVFYKKDINGYKVLGGGWITK